MIDAAVSKLAVYALRTGLIEESEYLWAVNTILDTLKLDSYTDPGQEWGEIELAPVLEELLDDAYARGVLTENSVVYRDLFDTELMGRLTPRPAQVISKFQALYREAPQKATDWYYELSQDTNYIRRDRIQLSPLSAMRRKRGLCWPGEPSGPAEPPHHSHHH